MYLCQNVVFVDPRAFAWVGGVKSAHGGSPPLEDVAFDEMNIVELPISLLSKSTDGIYEIPLSSDGKSKLVCAKSSEYGLPNSLAPRVLLGLMWLWSNEHPDEPQTFTFKLRDLVKKYMYPARFERYPPGGRLLQSVWRQLNAIRDAGIHTDRWYDRRLQRHRPVNFSLLDGVSPLDEGGRNRPKIVEVTWGRYFWESMVHRYTKSIDARLVQALDRPIDLQLYRLLDRQLSTKPRQHYADIVSFARYKLGMHGQKLDAGGRTSSTYVARCLHASLSRLSRKQFRVRMTIARASDPFSVTFERIGGPSELPHEIRDEDPPADLIREFNFHAHGVPRDQKRPRVHKTDRLKAKEWIDTYGFEQARWMVEHCVRLQKERDSETILVFRGLQLYESAAAGAYEQHQAERAGQLRLAWEDKLDRLWEAYQRRMVEVFDSGATPEQLSELSEQAVRKVREQSSAMQGAPQELVKLNALAYLKDIKRRRLSALDKEEFRTQLLAHQNLPAFRRFLAAHHGFEALPPQARA